MTVSKIFKIMLIEDDEELRQIISSGLKDSMSNKISIDEYDNAEFALSKSFKNQCDLVIIDFRLHGMSGLEFIKAIRNFPKGQLIPIIFISGYSFDTKSKSEIDEFDNLVFLEKPFTVSELAKQIGMYIL